MEPPFLLSTCNSWSLSVCSLRQQDILKLSWKAEAPLPSATPRHVQRGQPAELSASFLAERGSVWEVEKNCSPHLAHAELPRLLWRAVVQTNLCLFVQPLQLRHAELRVFRSRGVLLRRTESCLKQTWPGEGSQLVCWCCQVTDKLLRLRGSLLTQSS